MANPQQPELRRSERIPALTPDASEAELSTPQPTPGGRTPNGPIPEEQRPGHHPEHDQDKPDLDAMAAKLGVVSEEDEPADAPHVEDDRATSDRTAAQSGTSTRTIIGVALLGPAIGYVVVRQVIRVIRRR